MPLVRLLAVLSLLCPVLSFAQAAPASSDLASTSNSSMLFAIAPESSYLWQLVPNQSSDKDSLIKLERSAKQQLLLMEPSVDRGILIAGDSPTLGDSFCLSIRSYVVARDRKDSDSTHLVRSTTCVPASKYRVKVVQQPDSVIHP